MVGETTAGREHSLCKGRGELVLGGKMKKKATVTEVGEKDGKWEKIRVVRLARVGCARHRQS